MQHTDIGADGGFGQERQPDGATETARAAANEAGEQARAVAGTAAEGARDVAQTAKEQAAQVATQAKEHGRDLAHEARLQVRQQAESQTHQIAGKLREFADEVFALVDGRPEEAPNVRGYADQAAGKVAELARRVERRGFDGALDDVKSFARRRPGAFLLGAAVAGFGVGRLVRNAPGSDATTGSDQMTTPHPEPVSGMATPQTTGLTPGGAPPLVEGPAVSRGDLPTTELPTGAV